MSRLLDRLNAETRSLHADADAEMHALLRDGVSGDEYRQFLTRIYGFVRPLEVSVCETTGIDRLIDARRLRKHLLLEHDLGALGMKSSAIAALPLCGAIPLFEEPCEALGWAYLVERMTLGHPNLFRHLASMLPGEVAFASSYLKCYFGALGDMWNSFGDALDAAAQEPHHETRILGAAKDAFFHHRRWRDMFDGKATSTESRTG